MPTPASIRYLLVTHIPFARTPEGVQVDGLWARDLEGLVGSLGPVRVAAPELRGDRALQTWGPTSQVLGPDSGVSFAGFPALSSAADLWGWLRVRAVLRREVDQADLVHTSNFFPPYAVLAYAHELAVRRGKKTVFVIAEDFQDMLAWEWVRNAGGALSRWRRQRSLRALDTLVCAPARTASLTLLHTPAAVLRYRLHARNGIAIRQPGHEREDVVGEDLFRERCAAVLAGCTLRIAAACRHRPFKGLDFLINAVALLAQQGIGVEVCVYGQGEETASLRALAARVGVGDRVSFPGGLPPGQEVYRALAGAHLFAMPHRTTDFGRAFFDALSAGLPVVAFRTPASADTVRDGVDGLLTPLDDIEGLAAGLRRFHEDRPLLVRAAEAARSRALVNTRAAWYGWRAAWTKALFAIQDR